MLVKGDWKQGGVSDKQSAELTVMSLYLLLYDSHALSRECVRVPPEAAHFFKRKSDCLGCAVLLWFVVCLTLLASFFLPSFVIFSHFCAAESERSLEESGEGGKAGQEKGSWEAEDSPEKMCGRWMCSDCYPCFDSHCCSNILCGE